LLLLLLLLSLLSVMLLSSQAHPPKCNMLDQACICTTGTEVQARPSSACSVVGLRRREKIARNGDRFFVLFLDHRYDVAHSLGPLLALAWAKGEGKKCSMPYSFRWLLYGALVVTAGLLLNDTFIAIDTLPDDFLSAKK
jgi:hypothetical protein